MNDLIERQAAIDVVVAWLKDRMTDVKNGKPLIERLKDLPSAQPEIVRCKDCKYWQDQQEGVVEVPICARPENKYEKRPFRFMIGEDGFCSFAERSEEQE